MPTPRAKTFAVAGGTQIVRLGRRAPTVVRDFDSVSYTPGTGQIVSAAGAAGKVMVLSLHGRGETIFNTGYSAACSGDLAYGNCNTFVFQVELGYPSQGADGVAPYYLKPSDNYWPNGGQGTGSRKDSRWLGFTNMTGAAADFITHRRLLALLNWAKTNAQYDPKRFYCAGFSMGAYGTMQFALRRPDIFAAIYPDSPQWRLSYDASPGTFAYADFLYSGWSGNWAEATPANSPLIRYEDGGGRLFDYVDHLTYISDPNKKLPWIGWGVNSGDPASNWDEHLLALEILKATGRGYAFSWGNGAHDEGQVNNIRRSYKYGLFKLGEGYPGFRNHTRDNNPLIDATGGINIGLTFRNVVETETSWSCQVTNIDGACEVDVFPISDVFKAKVPMQHVVISGANDWRPVSFNA